MMKESLDKFTSKNFSGICGILASLVIFTSILLAIYVSPWFRWTNNALSDLGVEEASALFFNGGLVLGGVLLFIFSLGLATTLPNKIGAYLLAFGSLSLMGIGLFPETLFIPHYIVSATFFVLLALSLFVIGITTVKKQNDRNIGAIACVFSVIAVCSAVLLNFFSGIAIPEAFASFPGIIWCMIYSVKTAQQF